MAFAISVWFTAEGETQVRTLWKALHDAGLSSYMHTGPYRPHITLAVCGQLDLKAFAPALCEAVRLVAPFSVECPSLGVFPNDPPVLFIGVAVAPQLLELHRTAVVLATEYGADLDAYCMPDRWVPHCTLAPELAPGVVGDALTLCVDRGYPTSVVVDRIGIIDTPAEVEIEIVSLTMPA